MDIRYIDYVSVSGRSWLHRLPAGIKVIFAAVGIGLLLWCRSVWVLIGTVIAVVILAASARLSLKTVVALMLYPVLFLAIIGLSFTGLTLHGASVIALRVFSITGLLVVLLLTTSYPALFAVLGRVLPGFLVAALFFTYRSIFSIADSLNNVRVAVHLRGGIDRRQPVSTIKRLGDALGHFITDCIDSSQRVAEGLQVRGFANRIYYSGVRDRRDHR